MPSIRLGIVFAVQIMIALAIMDRYQSGTRDKGTGKTPARMGRIYKCMESEGGVGMFALKV